MLRELDGKVAVVTGGASGIGAALVTRLLAEGMSVAVADVEAEPLAAAAVDLPADRILTVRTDVADADAVADLAERVLARFGAVHLVCNNAGVAASGPSWELDADTWRWVLGVNLEGVVNGIRAFVPHLRARDEGHVVNTASIAGLVNGPFMAPYSASKAAVVATSEVLWKELRAEGSRVGVSVVCPAGVRTNFATSSRNRPGAPPAPAVSRTADAAVRATASQQLAPEVVADAIVDAVRTDRFWVLTHPGRSDAITRRAAQIVAGLDPDPDYPT